MHEKLIDASAKLRILKSLFPKLKARGHRVLLFSQARSHFHPISRSLQMLFVIQQPRKEI